MERPSPAPDLVCFDLGGVIVRICRTWEEGLARASVPVRDGPTPTERDIADLIDAHQRGVIDLDVYARRLSERIGGLYSPEEIAAVHHAWTMEPYAGLDALIDDLHAHGLTTAALSNTTAEHWAFLPSMEPIARMRHRLASHELGLRKPDEAIYREAERRFGRAGGQILFFDDLAENVEAARSVGWRAVQIDPRRETAPQIRAGLEEHGVGIGG